jgi:hypothetical protein
MYRPNICQEGLIKLTDSEDTRSAGRVLNLGHLEYRAGVLQITHISPCKASLDFNRLNTEIMSSYPIQGTDIHSRFVSCCFKYRLQDGVIYLFVSYITFLDESLSHSYL